MVKKARPGNPKARAEEGGEIIYYELFPGRTKFFGKRRHIARCARPRGRGRGTLKGQVR